MQTLAKCIGLHWCWGFFVSFGEEMHTIIEVISKLRSAKLRKFGNLSMIIQISKIQNLNTIDTTA